MKNNFLIIITLFFFSQCSNKVAVSNNCYKGRLEVKGICLNYTIKLLEGNIDTSRIAGTWRDEHSGKVHQNVFALESPCSFPESIKEGDEFYFLIDNNIEDGCMKCEAYYPTPPKSLKIKVISQPCAL